VGVGMGMVVEELEFQMVVVLGRVGTVLGMVVLALALALALVLVEVVLVGILDVYDVLYMLFRNLLFLCL
jgi:hypothetical protein